MRRIRRRSGKVCVLRSAFVPLLGRTSKNSPLPATLQCNRVRHRREARTLGQPGGGLHVPRLRQAIQAGSRDNRRRTCDDDAHWVLNAGQLDDLSWVTSISSRQWSLEPHSSTPLSARAFTPLVEVARGGGVVELAVGFRRRLPYDVVSRNIPRVGWHVGSGYWETKITECLRKSRDFPRHKRARKSGDRPFVIIFVTPHPPCFDCRSEVRQVLSFEHRLEGLGIDWAR